ncbi:hypothetical protein OJ997_21505 [Solirubrobacter phytolaccae]|uniref:Uncharacterized protein n=1 Tax=Solirubrobacter phytolaccae TaxID=1404360 RepID=A0A9X3NAN2_9ACTN|nr:hypothetical protein [Solirubrobacter phytolaccae]MDA0182903.1 hypothetical protein [Solirubrobacter phytolaccae]
MSDPLDGVLLATSTVNGLEFAAARRGGRPLSTVDIIVGLITADVTGAWDDIQLKGNFVDEADIERFPDPDQRPDGTWHRVPLTHSASAGLRKAVEIAADYHLVPVPPGVLALGLLADREAGASRALLDGSDLTHGDLLALVQDDLLDVELEGFDPTITKRSRLAGALTGPSRTPDAVRTHDWVEQPPGALLMLAGAVEQADDDEDLHDLLDAMLLDPEELRSMDHELRELEDVDTDTVLQRARRRFGVSDPDPAETIVAAALVDSPRVREALRRIGLTNHELVAQTAEFRLRRVEGASGDERVFRTSILNAVLTTTTSVLVVKAAFDDDGDWWKLLFLWPVWSGHPQSGPAAGTVIAALLAVLVSPLAGLAHFVSLGAELLQISAERRTLHARTGVRLSAKELRSVTLRLLTVRSRAVSRKQQALRARVRRIRDGRDEAVV